VGIVTETPPPSQRSTIPGCVLDWASCVLGAITGVLDASRSRANSRVWELTCADGPQFFLKVAPNKAAYDHEIQAYRFAVPALGPGRAPRLQAANPGELAMLLTAVPGETVGSAVLDMNDLIRVHRQAGYLLRELHDTLVAPRASMDVLVEVRARTASAGQSVAAAGALLSHAEQEMVLRLVRELPQLEACPEAFVHGDARELNFLWDGPSGCAALLDFGQARPAMAVDDFVHLAVGPWMQSPRLRRMFFSGYGRELTGPERRVLPALAAMDAVDGLVHGVRVDDPEVIVLAPTAAVLDAAHQRGWDTSTWGVVPHALLHEPPEPNPVRVLSRLQVGDIRILSAVGDTSNGIVALLRAARHQGTTVSSCVMRVAAATHYLQSGPAGIVLAETCRRQVDLAAHMSWSEEVPWHAVPAWLSGAAIVITPSTGSLGMVALEAMAVAVPVIGYRSGHLPYLIGPAQRERALLAEPQHGPCALLNLARALLASPRAYCEAAQAAYEQSRLFTKGRITRRFLAAVPARGTLPHDDRTPTHVHAH